MNDQDRIQVELTEEELAELLTGLPPYIRELRTTEADV